MTAEQKYYANTFLVVNLTLIYYRENVRRCVVIRFIDPFGLDTVWALDQANRPVNNSEYSATLYVEQSGVINGPYEGSSFPDSNTANTLNEGEYQYNNLYGHSGGSRQGLNLVDNDGNRNSSGSTPDGDDITMTNVNVHDSFNDTRRHSEGCITVPNGDPDGFFNNFDWSGAYNGNTGTTGNSTGTLILIRGANAESMRQHIERRQNPNFIPTLPIIFSFVEL
jgi:hypothetical protein